MTDYRVLTDDDVRRWLSMPAAIAAMEAALLKLADGELYAPPRLRAGQGPGKLVFTVGGVEGPGSLLGFRVYDTFPQQAKRWDQRQIVVVYDGDSGHLKGLVIGRRLGAMRTAALGGVALRYLARQDARRLAIVGSGFHARFQVAAALAVRAINAVRIASRTKANASAFAAEVAMQYGVDARVAASIEEAVGWADIVICATDSRDPVLDKAWLRPGLHVSTIGPHFRGAQELPGDIVDVCDLVVTDSPEQIRASEPPFFIADVDRIVPLSSVVAARETGRPSLEAITLFCSVGLAGTEVLLGGALLQASGGR